MTSNVRAASVLAVLLSTPVLAAQQQPQVGAPLRADERAALGRAERPDLEGLRAAAFGPSTRLDDSERALLREAASRHPELADLRAGDLNLSDREVKIILITAAVVVVIALIL